MDGSPTTVSQLTCPSESAPKRAACPGLVLFCRIALLGPGKQALDSATTGFA
jgi:hypothetical protein